MATWSYQDMVDRSSALQGAFTAIARIPKPTIAAALAAFDPDLLVVDRYARGFRGELEPALADERFDVARVFISYGASAPTGPEPCRLPPVAYTLDRPRRARC